MESEVSIVTKLAVEGLSGVDTAAFVRVGLMDSSIRTLKRNMLSYRR